MLCRYRTTAVCNCPIDGTTDTYSVEILSEDMVKIEDINAAIATLRVETMFQEELTKRLAKTLGASVATTGTHSGVYAEIVAP